MPIGCTIGIKNAVEKYIGDKPWFKFNKSDFIQILSSPKERINPENYYGIALSTAKELNKAINSDSPIGKVFYPISSNNLVGISISPSEKQLSILNANDQKEYSEALEALNEVIPLNDRMDLENDTTFNVNKEGDSEIFYQQSSPDISYVLKSVNSLQSEQGDQFFRTTDKNNIRGEQFWKQLQEKLQIPKEQIDILKSLDVKNPYNKEELLTSLLANYSYTIEINTAKSADSIDSMIGEEVTLNGRIFRYSHGDWYDSSKGYTNEVLATEEQVKQIKSLEKKNNTDYYSNLTVPGGTNYTENEIAIPNIVPSIKGHAQFSTDNGIGWFRSDEQAPEKFESGESNYTKTTRTWFDKEGNKHSEIISDFPKLKTRRILEVQSDLFQKGRDKTALIKGYDNLYEENGKYYSVLPKGYGGDEDSRTISITKEEYNEALNRSKEDKENQFLQLLNKNNNWVTFFVKSIIQDSAKKEYEKVLFPSGDTASKVEGHTTLEEFKKQKEDRIKELEINKERLKDDEYIDTLLEEKRNNSDDDSPVHNTEKSFVNYEKRQIFYQQTQNINREINQLKEELKRIETEGFAALKPIYNFYENQVKNILKKNYDVKEVKDEYGNTWNEISLDGVKDLQNILLQNKSVPSSKASEDTLNKIKEAAKKMGIDIQSLSEYAKSNPNVNTKNINGLADVVKGIIAIATGRESQALTEEYVHIATEMLNQTSPEIVTELISKINRFKIYKQTFEEYKNKYILPNGKPDIRKIKKEAVDKLITEVIINQNEGDVQFPELMQEENRTLIQKWWDAIIDAIKGMYRTANINIFQDVAKIVGEGNIPKYKNIIPTQALKTFDFGEKEGTPQNDNTNNIVHNNIINSPNKPMYDEGETFNEAYKRIIPTIENIVENAPNNSVIVTHNSVYGLIKLWNEENRPQEFDKEERIKYTKQDNLFDTGEHFKIEGNNGTIYIVRHGETEDNKKNVFRTSSTNLTPKGIQEAKDAGKSLSNIKISNIYSSPLSRTIHSSNLIMEEQPNNEKLLGNSDVFLQLKNNVVDDFYNKIIDIDRRTELIPEINGIKRHYVFDGKDVYRSVTEKVKANNTMPERTGSQKIMDDQKKEWGNEGHAFMENYISNNLIDENGYAREEFLDDDVETELNPSIQKSLKEFAKELIRSYAEGTRFLVEKKVVNTKEKGMLASTVDFKALEPTPDGNMKIDTLDWKFTSIDKTREEDIPWYKKKEWIPQMGEYTKIDREYGALPNQIRKARMIPFIINYNYTIPGSKKAGLYASSVEIGKLDSTQETNLYLLPVPTDVESTGSKSIDSLVKALNIHYDKLAKQYVSPENKEAKDLRLKELSKAIRSLRMRLDFAPLANVGKTFLQNANRIFKTFENINYSLLTKEDVINKLGELIEFKTSAEKFATLDKTYLDNFPKEALDKEAKEILSSLEAVSGSTERMMGKIIELQKEYVVQLALKEDVTTEDTKENILSPEKEIKGVFSSFSEPSRLGSKIIKLATNLLLNTRSVTNIEMGHLLKEFENVILPLEKLASSTGKKAFDYIGKVKDGKLSLIRKLDKKLFEDIHKAKEKKDKKFFIENMNMEEYNVLSKEAIIKATEEINRTHYSSDEQDNIERREYEIKNLENSLNINSPLFDGWTSFRFNRLFRQTLKEEPHYSEEYKNLLLNKEALNVWNFFSSLNERGIQSGYLSNKDLSFFALIEASMLQRLHNSDSLLKESGDLFEDLYKVRINEESEYSKIDPETNKPIKAIPKLFTRTDKDVKQLSTDLTKVGTLWIKYLLEYEAARNMENILLTLESVERAKGHIVTDEKGEIIWENGSAKIDENENSNANRLQTIIDDGVYGLREDLSSIGAVALTSITKKLSKDEETANRKAVSIKKGLESANLLTQSLAVGLKAAIAIPNYFGNHFQSFINNGGLYKYSEFLKNHVKMISSINLTTIEKALIDKFVPLNGDPQEEGRREIAFKQGYVKWLGTWTMQQAMMSTNFLPERNLQFTNALSLIDNAMVKDGKIVNIRQFLRKQELSRYKEMSYSERKTFEKGFDERVETLKQSSSLSKIAKIEGDSLIIPDVSKEEVAKFRTKIVEWGRNLNGQMSQENKAGYRRDVILKSLAMFRNWIAKQVAVRGHDISKNLEIGDWEYGRTRAFMKTWVHLGLKNTFKMLDIIRGTEKGLSIMNDILEDKKEEYYKKTGQQLEITQEEFYDMMRRELSNEMKELGMLIGLITLVIAAKLAAPSNDEDPLTKNKYKYWAKIMNKISNEVDFYYDPLSFTSMTKGNFLPALGLLTKAQKAFTSLGTEAYGNISGNDKMAEGAHPTKDFLDMIPVASQFEREWIPLFDPDLAKEMGIKVTIQPRIQQ